MEKRIFEDDLELDLRDIAEGSLLETVEGMEGGVRAGRDKVGAAVDSGVKMVLTGVEALEGQAAAASAKLADGGVYGRRTPGSGMLQEMEGWITRHPLGAVGVAACCGALLGLAICRRGEAGSELG